MFKGSGLEGLGAQGFRNLDSDCPGGREMGLVALGFRFRRRIS